MWACSFKSTQSAQAGGGGARRGRGSDRTHFYWMDVLLVHPGIEGIFCFVSIDLNTLRGFQDRVRGGGGSHGLKHFEVVSDRRHDADKLLFSL